MRKLLLLFLFVVLLVAGGIWGVKSIWRLLRDEGPKLVIEAEIDPFAQYATECSDDDASIDCAALRGIIRYRMIAALGTMENSGDRRVVAEALQAAELEDEPAIQQAACRVLGRFIREPRVSEKLIPLLLSSYPAVRRAAAEALEGSDHENAARVARQLIVNQRTQPAESSPYDQDQVQGPTHSWLPIHPNSVAYPPGQSDRSAAWLTTDPLPEVTAFYSRELGVEPVGVAGWRTVLEEAQASAFMRFNEESQVEMQAIQKLAESQKGGFSAEIMKQVETISARLDVKQKDLEKKMSRGLVRFPLTPRDIPREDLEAAQFLISERDAGEVKRVLVIYPERTFGKTVIQAAWERPE